MYRPPISSGYLSVADAIAGGLSRGMDRYQQGRRQRVEDERYAADVRRRAMMDKRDEADRNRRTMLENAELGVIDEGDAYEEVPDLMSRPLAAIIGNAEEGIAPARTPTVRQMRPGVSRVGGMYVDPRRSLPFQRSAAVAEAEGAREQQDRSSRYQQALTAAIAAGHDQRNATRIATQAAYDVDVPQTREEALADLEAELALRDRFEAQADQRNYQQDVVLRSITANANDRPSPSEVRKERADTLKSFALSSAYDAVRDELAPAQAVERVAAEIRHSATQNGMTVSSAEARALAVQHLADARKEWDEVSGVTPEERTRQAQELERARRRHGNGPLDPDEAIRRRNVLARAGAQRGRAVLDLIAQGENDATIRQVFPELTPEYLARARRESGTPNPSAPARRQPARQPANNGGPRIANPNARVDPAVVAEGARRIRAGTNLDELRAYGFTEEEIRAMQEATMRR